MNLQQLLDLTQGFTRLYQQFNQCDILRVVDGFQQVHRNGCFLVDIVILFQDNPKLGYNTLSLSPFIQNLRLLRW